MSDPASELLALARAARSNAHAPYSRYAVGAALETRSGRRFPGCNVENASFPVGVCAERLALGAAVCAGERSFRRIVICTGGSSPAPPCGACLQALAEFGDLDVISHAASGASREWRLSALLPEAFSLPAGDADRRQTSA